MTQMPAMELSNAGDSCNDPHVAGSLASLRYQLILIQTLIPKSKSWSVKNSCMRAKSGSYASRRVCRSCCIWGPGVPRAWKKTSLEGTSCTAHLTSAEALHRAQEAPTIGKLLLLLPPCAGAVYRERLLNFCLHAVVPLRSLTHCNPQQADDQRVQFVVTHHLDVLQAHRPEKAAHICLWQA